MQFPKGIVFSLLALLHKLTFHSNFNGYLHTHKDLFLDRVMQYFQKKIHQAAIYMLK